MDDMVFGPMRGCPQCGNGSGTYRPHAEWCRFLYERQQHEILHDTARGTHLLRAIEANDAEGIGRVLRGLDRTPSPRIPEPRAKTDEERLGPFSKVLAEHKSALSAAGVKTEGG